MTWELHGRSLQDLAGLPDMVITMLTDENALDQVYFGPHGLLSEAVDNQLFIDMSTVNTVNVATMRKDMHAMLDQAQLQDFALPVTALALKCFDLAASTGLDSADCTQLPVWWLAQGGKAWGCSA